MLLFAICYFKGKILTDKMFYTASNTQMVVQHCYDTYIGTYRFLTIYDEILLPCAGMHMKRSFQVLGFARTYNN